MDVNDIVSQVMTERVIADGIGFQRPGKYIPQSPTERQKLFLDIDDKLEVFYGGAAGGGKSSALLMAALEYVHVPGYAALLLRKTYADLSKPGALMDRAHSWLHGKAHWSSEKKTWTFPSGATLTFGYLETEIDKYQYQSAEFQFIGMDEVTHFTESQYRYLFSRLRRLKGSNVPIRMRAASNPDNGTGLWVKDRFIPEDFTPEDAEESRVWEVYAVDEETGERITRYFVPARLDDNPHIDQEEYELSLRELDPIERAQLRRGDWSIAKKGDILYMWSEPHVIIPWSRFNHIFNVNNHVPLHWQIGVFQDWGTTRDHPCVTGWFATAGENSPVINDIPLAGSVFCYRLMTTYKETARQVKQKIFRYMMPYNEIPRTRHWEMSHEASSERMEYLVEEKDSPYVLPFINWETGKTRGIEQLKNSITPRHLDKPHPFNPGVKGRPKLYFIVSDDEFVSPKTDLGMARVRQEAPAYRWAVPRSGDIPKKLEPHALFNDAMDVVRSAAASYFPRIEELSAAEEITKRIRSRINVEPGPMSTGKQLALMMAQSRVMREMKEEFNIDEFGDDVIDYYSLPPI